MTGFVRAGAALASAFVVLVGFTGCESVLDPSGVAGTYVLESVGGRPLPAVVWDDEFVRATILADTFRLHSDGTGTRVYALDVKYLKESQRDGKAVFDRQVSYQLKGNDIALTHVCGPAELCAPPPHHTGRISSAALRLGGEPGPYVYRRVER